MVVSARTPTGLTQPERSARSDARMADAAIALICERGAAATTLKDVGLRAGYSRGLASYRFGSKEGLWSFLISTIGAEWLAELQRAVDGTAGLQTIHAALDAHCRFLLESSERIRAFYVLWFESVGPDPMLQTVITGAHARRQRDVEEWITRGIETGTIEQRPGQIDPARIANQRRTFHGRSAGRPKAKQLSGFVEGLACGVVNGGAKTAIAAKSVDGDELAMPSGDQQ